MLRLFVILFLCVGTSFELEAELVTGARPLAMAGAFCTVQGDINCLFQNIAGISGVKKNLLNFSYMPVYTIDDLYSLRAGYIFPYLNIKVGAGLSRLSLKDVYDKNEVVLGCATSFQDYLLMGLRIKYVNEKVQKSPGESSDLASGLEYLTLDLGFIMRLLDFLEIGLSGQNITDPRISFSRSSLNSASDRTFITGLKVDFTKGFSLTFDQEFRKSQNVVLSLGSELWFYDTVAVRAGLGKNDRMSLGAGIKTKFVSFDFGLESHPVLGNQYQWDATFCF